MGTLADTIKLMNRKNTIGKVLRLTGVVMIYYGFHNTKKLIKDESNDIKWSNKDRAQKIIYPVVGGAVCYVIGTHTSIRACVNSSNAAVTEVEAFTDKLSKTTERMNYLADIADARFKCIDEEINIASLNMNKEHYYEFFEDFKKYVNNNPEIEITVHENPVNYEKARKYGKIALQSIDY